MTPEDLPKFAELMYGLSAYYEKKLPEQKLDMYWRALSSREFSDITNAANAHLNDPDSGQYWPKVADFNRIIDGSKQSRSMVAWTKVDKSIRQVGPWESVCFDDPIIMRVIHDMGGWIALCDVPTEKDLEFKMHEFSKRYQSYALQGGAAEYPKQLSGNKALINASNGHDAPETILLGNPAQAKLVNTQGQTTVKIEAKKASDVSMSVVAQIADQREQGAA